MSSSLPAPGNITTAAGDCSVRITWSAVEGAETYKVFLYKVKNPDECIKTYRATSCMRDITGLLNGTAYLVSVCALSYIGKAEFQGELSEKVRFAPASEHLKAQNVLCLSVGEEMQLRWEYKNRVPRAEFSSDDENTATVDESGKVTAVAGGMTHITIRSMGEEFRTRVVIGRQLRLERASAVLMFAGDIMCTARNQKLAEKYSYDFNNSFNGIKEKLTSADLTLGVLGTSCYDSAAYEVEQPKLRDGTVNTNSPSTLITAIANAGFDGLVTANGSCCVQGKKGLAATVSAITSLGMKNIGTMGANPVMINVKGIKFAFIAAAGICEDDAKPDKAADNKRLMTGQFTRSLFAAAVKASRDKGAEYIIVFRCRSVESPEEVKKLSDEAQFIADCGADLIVGTYPSGVRRFRKIMAADGRKVPCAFSLGGLLGGGTRGSKNGILLRAEFTRNDEGGIEADFSYIPCRSEERVYGVEVVPLYPCCSETGKKALAEIAETLKDIGITGKKPRVLINGSLILEKIFSTDNRFKVDKTGLLISPLAVCGTPDYEFSEKDGDYANVDICKTLPDHINQTAPDFIAVDFYSAAGLSSYKLRENLFTGTKTFTRSVFFNLNKDAIERLRPPISEEVWKPHLREYAGMLLKYFRPEKIVLFRHRFPGKALRDGNIRSTTISPWLNSSMAAMESYFIDLVSPSVVDVSDGYFTAGKQLSDFEREYFADAYRAFCKIALSGHRYEYLQDIELRFNRLLTRYESMSARGHFDWLLKFDSAADQIIAYTSREFSAANAERLIRLRKAGKSDLSCVRDFFDKDICAEPLVEAAEIIDAVLKGDISMPYEFFKPAFDGKFNILKKIATLLSEEIGMPVDEQDAELVFMLRGKPQLEKYIASISSYTVDVWGTSISRESLKQADGAHIGNQIYMQPPILAYEEAVQTKFSEDLRLFGGSSRRRMYITDALMRTGLDVINESKSKWLLIDLYELINVMSDYDGDIFELDEFMAKTGYYKSIKEECSECMLEDLFGEENCISRLDRFAADMLYKYDDRIILIRSEPKKHKGQTEEEEARVEKNKAFLKMCEESFIAGTRCYVINIAERFNEVEQVSVKIARTIHYEDEFYRQCGRYITDIIRGTDKKVFSAVDENYLLLKSIRSKQKK